MLKRAHTGDTMIEVLLAVTIFSVVAVTGLTIMNQGSAASQRSLEITLVRNEMEAQATALRFMYDAALAQKSSASYDSASVSPTSPAGKWNAILALRKSSTVGATPFVNMTSGISCIRPSSITNAFIVNPRTASLYTYTANVARWPAAAPVFSRVRFDPPTPSNLHPTTIRSVEGIWIEAVRRDAAPVGGVAVPGYTDFHIRACWSTVGQSRPATLGTIVRLYEP